MRALRRSREHHRGHPVIRARGLRIRPSVGPVRNSWPSVKFPCSIGDEFEPEAVVDQFGVAVSNQPEASARAEVIPR